MPAPSILVAKPGAGVLKRTAGSGTPSTEAQPKTLLRRFPTRDQRTPSLQLPVEMPIPAPSLEPRPTAGDREVTENWAMARQQATPPHRSRFLEATFSRKFVRDRAIPADSQRTAPSTAGDREVTENWAMARQQATPPHRSWSANRAALVGRT